MIFKQIKEAIGFLPQKNILILAFGAWFADASHQVRIIKNDEFSA
jgi:hypothetical protein